MTLYDTQSGVALDDSHEKAVDAEIANLEAIRDRAHGRRVPISTTAMERSLDFMRAADRLPTLFDLEDAAYELLANFENSEGATEADTEAQLALVDQMIAEKVESYVSVIRSLEKMAEARKAEADRLIARAKSAAGQADWLKDRLLVHMKTDGRPRIETARFSLSIRKNPESVSVVDASLIPADFWRQPPVPALQPDLVAIKAHTKSTGEMVAGTELVRTERLAIS